MQCTLFSQLEDLDFADDLAILSSKQDHLQEKTTRLHYIAKQIVLNINTIKTQIMCINPTLNAQYCWQRQHHTKIFKCRWLRWLGHVLRMDQHSIPKVALRWTPPGKRRQGRPKITWRKTVTSELAEMHLTWGEAEHVAMDRDRWRQMIAALCPIGDEED